jgi:CPA1 family monovalent cation:H+ antiporter
VLLATAAGAQGAGIDLLHVGQLLFIETLGGATLGLVTGYLPYRAMRAIDDYPIEVLISLALVTGTYTLAGRLHMSGPIAVVVAGLLIGNRGPRDAFSDETQRYLFAFWTLIDEILNSVLFLLIGLEVLVLRLDPSLGWLAVVTIPLVLFARLIAVSIPMLALNAINPFVRGTIPS